MKNTYSDLLLVARNMGLQVVEGTINDDHLGRYDHLKHRITIDGRLNDNQKRVALLHEIIHAEHFNAGMNLWMTAKNEENLTVKETAERIVDLRDYAQAEQVYGPDPCMIANELCVTRAVIVEIQRILEANPWKCRLVPHY